MKQPIKAKVTRIGSSRASRLPADQCSSELVRAQKLSWNETYKEMASTLEDWSDLDTTLADGL